MIYSDLTDSRVGAETISWSLAAAGYAAADAGASLPAANVYPSLSAMDLALALTAPTTYAGQDAGVLDTVLRRPARYAETEIRAAVERMAPPASVMALTFTGAAAAIDLAPMTALGNSFTLAAWVWLRHDPSRPRIRYDVFGCASQTADVLPTLGVMLGQYVASLGTADTSVELTVPAEDIGAWVHLAVTWDTSTLCLYRNGIRAASRSLPAGTHPKAGRWFIGGPQAWSGSLRHVALWKTGSLDEQMMMSVLGGGRPMRDALVADWPLADGAGTTCFDLSANRLMLPVTGGTWTERPALPDPLGLVVRNAVAQGFRADMAEGLIMAMPQLVPNLAPLTAVIALALCGIKTPGTSSGFNQWFPDLAAATLVDLLAVATFRTTDPTEDRLAHALAAARVPATRALVLTLLAGPAASPEWALVTLKRAGYDQTALTWAFRRPNCTLAAADTASLLDAVFTTSAALARRRLGAGDSVATTVRWLVAAYPALTLSQAAAALTAAGAAEADMGRPLRAAFKADAKALAAAYMAAFKPSA